MTKALPSVLHSTSLISQFCTPPAHVEGENWTDQQLYVRAMILASLSVRLRFLCYQIEEKVESWAVRHVAPTLAGDLEVAKSLFVALPNYQRGVMAVILWQAKIPVPAYRVFLLAVWDHDHLEVINAAATRRRLRAMFRYAQFDTSCQPDTIRVWRGTLGIDAKAAAAGYSWTTDRDIACWFAMRFADKSPTKSPLVLMAEVRRDMVACYTNERSENEIVLFTPPAAVVDGTAAEWTERFHTEQSKRQREKDAFMNQEELVLCVD